MKKVILAMSLCSAMFASAISVENPWVKITPDNAKNSAIFMQIKNNSDQDVKLIDAKSDYAASTEIHTHVHENGMMKMLRIKDADIKAHQTLELKPKSYHIMLMGINKGVNENTKVNLELKFSNGEVINLKDIPAKAMPVGDHHDHAAHEHAAHDHADHEHAAH